MSQSLQIIGGSLVAYRHILEGGGTIVCIGTTEMVTGMMVEVDENEFVPSLSHSFGGTGA